MCVFHSFCGLLQLLVKRHPTSNDSTFASERKSALAKVVRGVNRVCTGTSASWELLR